MILDGPLPRKKLRWTSLFCGLVGTLHAATASPLWSPRDGERWEWLLIKTNTRVWHGQCDRPYIECQDQIESDTLILRWNTLPSSSPKSEWRIAATLDTLRSRSSTWNRCHDTAIIKRMSGTDTLAWSEPFQGCGFVNVDASPLRYVNQLDSAFQCGVFCNGTSKPTRYGFELNLRGYYVEGAFAAYVTGLGWDSAYFKTTEIDGLIHREDSLVLLQHDDSLIRSPAWLNAIHYPTISDDPDSSTSVAPRSTPVASRKTIAGHRAWRAMLDANPAIAPRVFGLDGASLLAPTHPPSGTYFAELGRKRYLLIIP